MQMNHHDMTVQDIVDLYKNGMLRANPEYQRGIVWSITQRKKLIDSVMRGYPLPLIYLHHIKKQVAGMQREDLEIIDGQQRIISLNDFAEGAYALLDPIKDDKIAKFPKFIKSQSCPWAGKDIHSLSEKLRDSFLSAPLSIVNIETNDMNEVRDLFVRLQSGLPLNAQETRDAWPGHFTDFVLRLGGKPQIARYPGHKFFTDLLSMRPLKDRGKTRQLCAQLAMLYFRRRENGYDYFSDINSNAISDFYHSHIDFDQKSSEAVRFVSILDKLHDLLIGASRPKLRGHDVFHLFLLVDSLWDDYTRSWEDSLPSALDRFLENLKNANATRDAEQPDPFWLRYGQWTRVNSDRGDRIRQRHEFYTSQMLEFLNPLQLRDSKRLFGPLEREIIYFRDKKKCVVCGSTVSWSDVQIHHIQEHSKGGQTTMDNGVLVHAACHPQGKEAVLFARRYSANRRGEVLREEETSPDIAIAQDGRDGLDLGQGAVIYVGEELYLFLSEIEKENNTPAAVAEVKGDGLYLYGEKIKPSRKSVLQPAMKIVQEEKDHRNSKGELVSLSAWRQWHVLRDGKFVRILDIKDPFLARRRRSPE